jgi:hypothetical protein
MSDENRIVTFEYALSNFESFRKQYISAPLSSNECVTKSELQYHYMLEPNALSTYSSNQLVPRNKCISGYSCNTSFMRSLSYTSSTTYFELKTLISGTGYFAIFLAIDYGVVFNIDIKDNTGIIVKNSASTDYTAARGRYVLCKIQKTTSTSDEYTLCVNVTYKRESVTVLNVSYAFSCAINLGSGNTGIAYPSNLYMYKYNNYATIRSYGIFVMGAQTPNYANISWNNNSNPLAFTDNKMPPVWQHPTENISFYQYIPQTNQYNANIGTMYSGYVMTFSYTPTSGGTTHAYLYHTVTYIDSTEIW